MEKVELLKIELGLDVATNTTGLGCFINGDLMYYGDIETSKGERYGGAKIVKDIEYINRVALGLAGRIKNEKLNLDEKKYHLDMVIALESSNHANASLGQKLATYIGIYSSAFISAFKISFPENEIHLKLINPREWQLRAFGRVLDRKDGKSESIERAQKYINLNFTNKTKAISDDTADAINIASLARIIRDNLIVGQERSERTTKAISHKKQILNLNISINKLLDTLRTKKAAQIERALLQKHNAKTKAQELKQQPLIAFATAAQKAQIIKYEFKLKELEQDLTLINQFHILGEIQ